MNRFLTDQAARDAIQNELDHSFLVEAGAGSGKTHSLVKRMVALIMSGRCRMESLAAVTFTRKAAGELRERFQVALEKSFAQASDPQSRHNLEQALSRPDAAFIGTIHSFCARILRERPVEAHLPPDFKEVEGLEEEQITEAAWEEYLLQLRLNNPEELKKIRELDISLEDLKNAYVRLALYPDVSFAAQLTPYPDLSLVRRQIYDLLDLARSRLPGEEPEKGWDKLQRLLRQALRWSSAFNLDNDRYLLRLLALLQKRDAKITLNRWSDKDTAKDTSAAFEAFREGSVREALQSWHEYRYGRLLEFLLPAVRHLEEVRRRENKVNFQDLLMLTADLLRDNPEVRRYFGNRFTHLLVDEFQDTDPIQAQIMMYLTATDYREKDWTKLAPRPGALFVVGDPKQSIYRFRRADIDTYNRVKEQILRTGGRVLTLSTNFRSLPCILEYVNPLFESLFSEEKPPYQAEPVAMSPFKSDDERIFSGVYKIELPPAERHRQEDIVREDAQRIARWIHHCLYGGSVALAVKDGELIPPKADDFMILVRYKGKMAHYARALEEYRIPFTLSGGSDISDSPELKELLPVLQALADPDNPVPMLALLRGLFFGVSDDMLYRYHKAGGRFSVLASVPAEAPQKVREDFSTILKKLQTFYRWAKKLPPSAALERIISDLGLIPYALAGSMGRGRAGYILQLLELVRAREAKGHTGFADMTDFIRRLLESGLEDELDITAGGERGVRIMNLHRAKGLEAPVVILANPSKRVQNYPDLHVRRVGDTPRGFILIGKRPAFGGKPEVLAAPPGWDDLCREEERYDAAEQVRLLYVAATRARNALVISTYPAKPEMSFWQPLERSLPKLPEFTPEAPPSADEASENLEPVTPDMLARVKEEITRTRKRVAKPTFNRETVTERAKSEEMPERFDTGRGMSFGNVIHRALEIMATEADTTDLQALAEHLLRAEGRDPGEAAEVTSLLHDFTKTAFWQRLHASSEVHAEVPFGSRENTTYLTGTVDLAFREKEGWVLADYKTDTIKNEEHFGQLVRYYTPQIREYARQWEKISGEPVKECILCFLSVMRFEAVT